MNKPKEEKINVNCHDGCKNIVFTKNHYDDCENLIYLEFFANLFYHEQYTFWGRLKQKISMMWNMMTRGKHMFFDMVLTEADIKQLHYKLKRWVK